VGGRVVSEAIAVGDRLYLRGAVARLVQPGVDEATWLAVDPAAIEPGSPASGIHAALATPISVPYPDLSTSARARELFPVGPVEVEGRRCDAYRYVATTETGGRVDVTVALGADDRLCAIETVATGVRSVTGFVAYDLPLAIEAPAGAVPVATPGATPAA
jgi:hypothetical protein